MVGPTNRKPRRLSSLAIAVDSGEVAGTSASVAGPRCCCRRERPQQRRRGPRARRRASARALVIVASILARLRTMPASASRRRTSASSKRGDRRRCRSRRTRRGRPARLRRIDQPGQPGLERLEREPLEQRAVAVQRPAPLVVVVGDVLRRRCRPSRSGRGRQRSSRCPTRRPVIGAGPTAAPSPLRARVGRVGGTGGVAAPGSSRDRFASPARRLRQRTRDRLRSCAISSSPGPQLVGAAGRGAGRSRRTGNPATRPAAASPSRRPAGSGRAAAGPTVRASGAGVAICSPARQEDTAATEQHADHDDGEQAVEEHVSTRRSWHAPTGWEHLVSADSAASSSANASSTGSVRCSTSSAA